MHALTAKELLNEKVVQDALEEAWTNSLTTDRMRRHEEGGWIYQDLLSGKVSVRAAPSGTRAVLDLTLPPAITGSVVIATFHTHPNPSREGWEPGPSEPDTSSAWFFGVPCLIRADDGIYITGPDSRRGGLAGDEGFPS